MPFFSVIIPLYNKEAFIIDTLNSVINQTFKDFEIIIINDGSTDNSLNIVSSFNDKRIQIINQDNYGLSTARNRGIKAAKGKFIAFLDADDLWMYDYLEKMHQLIFTHKNYKVFATNVKVLNNKKKPNLESKKFDKKHIKLITNYFKLLRNILGPSSLVIKQPVFKKTGYFDETINYGEEDDFYLRCFSHYDLVYYNDYKTYYRTGIKNQLTAPSKNFNRKIPDYEKYLKVIDKPDLNMFLDFVHYRLVVLFKMERNHKQVKFYKGKINVNNLTNIQKIKYYLPTTLFVITKNAYLSVKNVFNSLK